MHTPSPPRDGGRGALRGKFVPQGLTAGPFKHLILEGDDHTAITRKISLALFFSVGFVFISTTAVMQGATQQFEGYGLYWVWTAFSLVGIPVLMAVLYARKKAEPRFVLVSVWLGAIAVALFDLHQASAGSSRAAPCFVVLVDILLIGRVPSSASYATVGIMLLWMLLMEIELTFRLGLLDVWGTATQEMRHDVCDCAYLPCGRPVLSVVRGSEIVIFVFILDFCITRRFAVMLEAEQSAMSHVILVSKEIASALASFDLRSARQCLDIHGDELPPELVHSFTTLLENLASYGPYLPQSCILNHDFEEDLTETYYSEVSTSDTSDGGGVGSTSPSRAASRASTSDSLSTHTAGMPRPTDSVVSLRSNFLRRAKVTLVHFSKRTRTGCPVTDLDTWARRHEQHLACILHAASACKGVVDAFAGMHVTASFNSAAHPSMAVAAVKLLHVTMAGRVRAAVATGTATLGTLGCDVMRRPCILGAVTHVVAQLERYAELRGLWYVATRAVYREVLMEHEMRVLFDVVRFDIRDAGRRGAPTPPAYPGYTPAVHAMETHSCASSLFTQREEDKDPIADERSAVPLAADTTIVYEICVNHTPRGGGHVYPDAGAQAGGAEWMYELKGSDQWETYNAAGAICMGQGIDAAVAYMRTCRAGQDRILQLTEAAATCRTIDFAPRQDDFCGRPSTVASSTSTPCSAITSPPAMCALSRVKSMGAMSAISRASMPNKHEP